MANFLSQVQKNWFIKKVGANAPISELKKRYYQSQGAAGKYLAELETNWLRIAIVAGGGTPSGDRDSDLWAQLVAVAGLRVSKLVQENQMTYYLNT